RLPEGSIVYAILKTEGKECYRISIQEGNVIYQRIFLQGGVLIEEKPQTATPLFAFLMNVEWVYTPYLVLEAETDQVIDLTQILRPGNHIYIKDYKFREVLFSIESEEAIPTDSGTTIPVWRVRIIKSQNMREWKQSITTIVDRQEHGFDTLLVIFPQAYTESFQLSLLNSNNPKDRIGFLSAKLTGAGEITIRQTKTWLTIARIEVAVGFFPQQTK
ncbi:MAG: hypothetical protein MUO21_03885, partial [Nitrososphaeraceae archaeon]|nr:hypothetical protein [Nitrososphaeraceae archaeon]